MPPPPSPAKPSGDALAGDRLPSFRATAEALPIGIFVADSRGAFSFINQRAAAIVGIAPTEALGLGWAASIHPEDRAAIIDAWQRAIRDSRPFTLQARVLRRGGAIRWIEVRANAVREQEGADAWVGLVDDISERRASEEGRLEAEAVLRSTLEAVADLVFDIDTEERFIRFFQPSHRDDLYAPPERFLGRALAEVMPPEVVALARAAFAEIARDGQTRLIEYSLPMPERERWFQTRISPRYGPGGALDGYVLVARDATERHLHLAELQHRRAEAEALATAARAADAAKGDFLANMSHEMRTPLSAVIGLSELLRESELDPEQERFVGLIAASARTLLGLVEDVLDFSRIEAGRLDLQGADFDLRQVVEEALAPVSLRAAEKGLDLHERIDAATPIALHGDADRLRQVILNLVDNAVKFTEVGEVSVELRAAPGSAKGGPALIVVVEDSGIGVPTDRLPQIFEPFRQADGSTSRRFGGTGLGLAIVRRILARMGATIAVESEVGVGSRFTVTIPLVLAAGAIAEPALGGRRLAVIDRHEDRRGWLRALIERWGGTLEALADPAELAARGPFDEILIVDARFGDELERWLRAADRPAAVTLMVRLPDLSTSWARELRRRGHRVLALPLHRLRLAAALQAPTPPARASAGSGRILVVDDSEPGRLLAAALLRRRGFEVFLASGGAEALAFLSEREVDLVLMDCQMPELDGVVTTAAIRRGVAGERARRVPIVALTANALASERTRCFAAGMDGFLLKPLDADALVAAAGRLIGAESPDALPLDRGRWAELQGLERASPGLLRELAGSFDAEVRDGVVRLRAALRSGDLPAIARDAHLLKGIAQNLGARALVEAASAVEAAASAGRLRESQIAALVDAAEAANAALGERF